MPATARRIPVTDKDLEGGGSGGAYAELDVPNDYEAVLSEVSDYDKTKEGKSRGWVFSYEVETPSGKTCEFNSYLSFGDNARWKLIEVLEAHEVDLSTGLNDVDPNALVGELIGVHIDFPRDRKTDEPTSAFREIRTHFALAEFPGLGGPEEEAPEEVDSVTAEEAPAII
jgi:hypothetical protein